MKTEPGESKIEASGKGVLLVVITRIYSAWVQASKELATDSQQSTETAALKTLYQFYDQTRDQTNRVK